MFDYGACLGKSIPHKKKTCPADKQSAALLMVEQAPHHFCVDLCTDDFPKIPTYPAGVRNDLVPPTVTDPDHNCVRDCQKGIDLGSFCEGLCPDPESGSCLTDCETKMHRCSEDSRHDDTEVTHGGVLVRQDCIKNVCAEYNFHHVAAPR